MIEHFPFPYTSLLKCLPKSKNTILIERINIRPETAGMLEVFGDARLGALAAGLKIVSYDFARKLPGDIGEAAGRWGVSANCGGRDRLSLSHSSDKKARPVICERVRKTHRKRNSPTQGADWETSHWEVLGIFA